MIIRTRSRVWLLTVIVAAAACSGAASSASDASKGAAAAAGPVNDPAVRAIIDSADQKFSIAFKAGDAAAAAAFYEQDAMSMPPNAEAASGRAAIEKGYADTFKALGEVNDC